ncbi:hypothetical protein [Actinoplanes sp. NPDC026623]|uniref:hypothetical protein n=1 Tax=Actinoplanes sp. NPDC026623 TaxID=3155610 RepID=UPI0033F39CFE
MTERVRADHGSTVGGLSIQMSRLLLVCLVVATAATGALIITILVGLPPAHPPPGPNGLPPPPPDLRPLATFPVVTGLFVLSWLSVVVVFSRDQILQRIRQVQREPEVAVQRVDELFAELRSQLAADRERELRMLEERIAELTTEYGEQRETDGYLSGLRVATTEDPAGKVHAIRRERRPGG